jgi:regulator of protease activity HflC (stomatin/prohibitin superfamily)
MTNRQYNPHASRSAILVAETIAERLRLSRRRLLIDHKPSNARLPGRVIRDQPRTGLGQPPRVQSGHPEGSPATLDRTGNWATALMADLMCAVLLQSVRVFERMPGRAIDSTISAKTEQRGAPRFGRKGRNMIIYVVVVLVLIALVGAALSIRILKQYERGVQFRLGRVKGGARGPGLIFIVPFVDRVHRVSLRIITLPIQSQGIITKDNVSVDVAAVAYYKVVDPVAAVVAIENAEAAINQIAQTTLRAVVGRHTLDETLSETDTINQNIREILDVQTEEWGIKVTVVELRDIQLPDSMKRAMARQAEAEREKRAKIIAAEGEALAAAELGHASDVMMAHPLALQLRNLQTLIEIAVDKNSTVVFPAPLMSTIGELGAFLNHETQAAGDLPVPPAGPAPTNGELVSA